MSLFSKLFKKNKNTITLTTEEAYAESAPQKANEPAVLAESAPVETEAPAPKRISVTNRVFACLDGEQSIASYLRPLMVDGFRSLIETGSGFEGVLDDGTEIAIAIPEGKDAVKAETDRLFAAFEKAPLLSRDIHNAVLMQIGLFNSALTLTFTLNEGAPTEGADRLADGIVRALKGFYLRDGSRLYRWDNKLTASLSGDTEFSEFMPVKCSQDDPLLAQRGAQEIRKRRSADILTSRGIPDLLDSVTALPVSDEDRPTEEEIIRRAACLLCVALTAKAYTSPKEVSSPATFAHALLDRFDAAYGVREGFTEKEKAYLRAPRADRHEAAALKTESCAVLLWALGLTEIGWPEKLTDIAAVNAVMKDADMGSLLHAMRPRGKAETADAYDLTVRLHAASVLGDPSRVTGAKADPELVYERHYALNWLLGVGGIRDWDKVLPTV